jgi:hypothetical protein
VAECKRDDNADSAVIADSAGIGDETPGTKNVKPHIAKARRRTVAPQETRISNLES